MQNNLKIRNFRSTYFLLAAVLFACCFAVFFTIKTQTAVAEHLPNPIISRSDFIIAIKNANDGDVIYAGDINFEEGIAPGNLDERVAIEKSVTVIGADSAKQSEFSGACFKLLGGQNSELKEKIVFQNIKFTGKNDEGTSLRYDDLRRLTQTNAFHITKYIDVTFENCDFTNYIGASGAAIWAATEETNSIALNINRCNFYKNNSLRGGSIYLQGYNKNLITDIAESNFFENGFADGGAINVKDGTTTVRSCNFYGNEHRDFGQPASDTYGGGLCVEGGSVLAVNSKFYLNKSINGGGIALVGGSATVDGCVIADNTAQKDGGGVYLDIETKNTVKLHNSSIYRNNSKTNGGLKIVRSIGSTGTLSMSFCTYAANVSTDGAMYGFDLWDYYVLKRIDVFGCFIVDNSLEIAEYDEVTDETEYLPVTVLPTEGSEYNYWATTGQNSLYDAAIEERPASEYGHLQVYDFTDMPPVPVRDYSQKFGNRFANLYGQYFVGTNVNPRFKTNYDADDGILDETSGVYIYGCEFSFPSPTKTGYSFGGWQTDDHTVLSEKNLIFGGDMTSVNLTALWTANSYQVTLRNNHSDEVITQVFNSPLSLPTPEKNGYRFAGWFTAENGGGDKIENGMRFSYDTDLTLYAYYEKTFPAWGIVLIVIGGLSVLCGGFFGTVQIRKRRLQTATAIDDSSAVESLPDESQYIDNTQNIIDKYRLTPREAELTRFLVEGKTLRQISGELKIEYNTVKFHCRNLYKKLNIQSKIELVNLCRKQKK